MTDQLPGAGEDDVHPPPPAAVGGPPLAGQAPVFVAVAVGGAAGVLARYGLALALPNPTGGFPTSTFLANVLGCLLIGGLLVMLTEFVRAHPLVRPLLVTGVLGGFTTFSTYAVETQTLLSSGRVGTALAYFASTLATALAATWAGVTLTRTLGRAFGRALAVAPK